MSETIEFFRETGKNDWDSFKKWEARCRELGLNGPYRLANNLTCWQFVRPSGGTAGIYDAAKGEGYVFVQPN